MKRTGVLLSVALLLSTAAVVTLSAIETSAPPKPERGGTFVYAIGSDITSFNPYLVTNTDSDTMAGVMYNSMLGFDEDLQYESDLAEKWEVSPDGKTYTFTIKKDIRWHDGKPFTLDDVEFTLNFIKNPRLETVRREYVEKLRTDPKDRDKVLFERVDERTFRVHYVEPYCPALSHWAFMAMLPRHRLAGKDPNKNDFNDKDPIGTGPFKYESRKTDEYVAFKANDDYSKGRANFDKILFRIIPKIETQLQNMETGQADFMEHNLMQVFKFIKERDAYKKAHQLFVWDTFSYAYIGWNCDPKRSRIFSDVRVRQAMSHGIDVRQLIDRTTFRKSTHCTGIFHPRMWAFNPDVKPYTYDPKKALDLLKQAGWEDRDGDGVLDKDGQRLEFTLRFPPISQQVNDRMALVKTHLKKIGVECKTEGTEWTVLLKNFIHKKQFDGAYLGWYLGFEPDPYNIWHSAGIPRDLDEIFEGLPDESKAQAQDLLKKVQEAADDAARARAIDELSKASGKDAATIKEVLANQEGFNRVSYRNAEVDRLIVEARLGHCAQEERQRRYRRVQQIIYEESPYTFLFFSPQYASIANRIRWHRRGAEPARDDAEIGTTVVKLSPKGVWTEDFITKSWIAGGSAAAEKKGE